MKRRVLAVAAGVGVAAGLTAEAVGLRAFSRLVRSDVQALLGRASPGKAGVVTEDMLDGLPDPVQRYLWHTGIVGTPMARTVYLRQRGRVRLAGQRWIPLAAQEWFSVRPPGFVWDATMRVAGLPGGLLARAGKTCPIAAAAAGPACSHHRMTAGPGIWVIRLYPPDPGCTSLMPKGLNAPGGECSVRYHRPA